MLLEAMDLAGDLGGIRNLSVGIVLTDQFTQRAGGEDVLISRLVESSTANQEQLRRLLAVGPVSHGAQIQERSYQDLLRLRAGAQCPRPVRGRHHDGLACDHVWAEFPR